MNALRGSIRPKALTKDDAADRAKALDDMRSHVANVFRDHIGARGVVSTSEAARTFGTSASYMKLARLADPALPMGGELRMVDMMGVLPLSFGNELLRGYGRQIVDLPGHGAPVSWVDVAHHSAGFAALVTGDASDLVFDLPEMKQQKQRAHDLLNVVGAWTYTIHTHLEAGTNIRLGGN